MDHPDYDNYKNEEDVEAEIIKFKDTICNKVKMQNQLKQQKKDSNASFNDTIKQLGQEIEYATEVIDQLKVKLKELQLERD